MGKSLLFLVGGLTIVTGIIQVRNQERVSEIPALTTDYYKAEQARNLAKSLVDNAVETMKANNEWTGSISLDQIVPTSQLAERSNEALYDYAVGNITQEQLTAIEEGLDGQVQLNVSGSLTSYTETSQNIPGNNSVGAWDEYKVLLVSTSTYDDIEVTTEVLMQRDSFSKYSYMTQSELSSSGSQIWFMGADNIYGPIHTNGTFMMSGTPSFYGLITSPNTWQGHSTNPTNPNFYGGENFNAPVKNAPNSYEIDKLTTAAADGGLRFTRQIYVQFFNNSDVGYAKIWEWTGTEWTTPVDYNLEDTNGIISSTGRVDVYGEVKGQVTLHSEDTIEIDGDITYVTSPLVDSSSTDMLGLVSEGDVRIDANAHSFSGTQDVTVHASIMALNTSFYVENYNSGGSKGTLNLLGGLIQQNRGPVGTFSGSSIVSGYAKNYQYDNRLRGSIPPSFPRESIFSIVYWKEEVNKVSN